MTKQKTKMNLETQHKTAVLYARSASDLQNGNSINNQIATCEAYANRESLKVIATFSDRAKSGASLVGRDGLTELRDAAKRGEFDAVIVESLDRLSRIQSDIADLFVDLNQCGVKILTARGDDR